MARNSSEREKSDLPLPHRPAVVRTAEGTLSPFVAIDGTSKFAVVELVEKADMQVTAAFLEGWSKPFRIASTACASVAIRSTGYVTFMESSTD